MKDVPFVPMIWGDNEWTMDSITNVKVAKSKADASPLLGFNEPDGKDQAKMSVERALELWPLLEKTNRRLGSPATVHLDNEWMKSFMKGAEGKGYPGRFHLRPLVWGKRSKQVHQPPWSHPQTLQKADLGHGVRRGGLVCEKQQGQ